MRDAGFQGLVIGVTGNVMKDNINEYIASGAKSVISKPVSTEKIKIIIESLFFASDVNRLL